MIKATHPKMFFKNTPHLKVDYQKHLGLLLDSKFIFDMDIKTIRAKVNKTIGLFRKYQRVLPR